MRIEVYKDWIIRSSVGDHGITLCKSAGFVKVKDKDGNETGEEKEVFKNETYPATIESALRSICNQEIVDCRATTFKGLQAEYRMLETMLQDIGEQLRERAVLK